MTADRDLSMIEGRSKAGVRMTSRSRQQPSSPAFLHVLLSRLPVQLPGERQRRLSMLGLPAGYCVTWAAVGSGPVS